MSSARVDVLYQAGREAWSGIEVSPETFAAHLQACARRSGLRWSSFLQQVTEPRWLYLAAACAVGGARDLRAWQLLDELVMAPIRVMPGVDDDLLEEVKQHVRLQFLEVEEQSRLYAYTGAGDLRGWTRRVVRNEAMDRLRRLRRLQGSGELDRGPAALPFLVTLPEYALLRRQQAPLFQQALVRAWADLSAEERDLLSRQLEHGRTIPELASDLKRRPLAIRFQLRKARTRLDALVQREFAQLQAQFSSSGSFRSALTWVRSHLEVALHRLVRGHPLADAPPADGPAPDPPTRAR